jgi:SAM-dependent methyltransferase
MSKDASGQHGAVFDFAEAAERMHRKAHRHDDRYRELADRLVRGDEQVLVDVGCGAAGMALALAAARPDARVVALDAEPAMIDVAQERSRESGISIEAAVCDVVDAAQLASAVGDAADLVWAGHVLHHATDQQAAVDNLAALLRPGGRLAVAEGGLTGRYLPWDVGVGRPGLEIRLHEAGSRRMEAEHAAHGTARMAYGWNLALARAELVDVGVLNTLVERSAPLEDTDLDNALEVLSSRVEWFSDYLDAEDQATWEALLDPDSPTWLGTRHDLYHLEVNSVHIGRKP